MESRKQAGKPGVHCHFVLSGGEEEADAKRGVGRARKWASGQEDEQGHFRGRTYGV